MAEALGAMGVKVAVLDISLEKAEARAAAVVAVGGSARAYRCDVLDPAGVRAACEAVARELGSAGFPDQRRRRQRPARQHLRGIPRARRRTSRPAASPFSSWTRPGSARCSTSTSSARFIVTQAFTRGMVARGRGAVVNISSMSAFTPLTKVPAYSAAKASVSNFTRWLAVHFAHTGVRVNALAPGFFMTEQLKFLHIDRATGELLPRARKVIAHTPMGRYGQPDDLIGALVWLLSEASAFVTGVVVPVDGGFSSYSI